MNDLSKLYFTMETHLFPMLEDELGELTAKMRKFLRIVEVVRPSRFITSALRWCGLGRPMKDREKMLLAFFLKAVYDLPTTKVPIENLKTNPSLRRICGWEYRGEVPSEATFSRAFKVFAEERVPDAVHAMIVKENRKAGRTRKHRLYGNRRQKKFGPQEYAENQALKEAGAEKQSGKSGIGGTVTLRNQNPAA